jgi:hypothetical protein
LKTGDRALPQSLLPPMDRGSIGRYSTDAVALTLRMLGLIEYSRP